VNHNHQRHTFPATKMIPVDEMGRYTSRFQRRTIKKFQTKKSRLYLKRAIASEMEQ
jgi:hypothetical protein